MNDCCEAKRPATICETAKRNGQLIDDISAGMSTLLELLTGPANNESCDVAKSPACLLDEMTRQNITLGEIHFKLNRAVEALNG